MSAPIEIVYRSAEAFGYRFEVHHIDRLYVVVRMTVAGDGQDFVIGWRRRTLERAREDADRMVATLEAVHAPRLIAMTPVSA